MHSANDSPRPSPWNIPSFEYHYFQVSVWWMSSMWSDSDAETWLWKSFDVVAFWKKRWILVDRGRYLNRFCDIFPFSKRSLPHLGQCVLSACGPQYKMQSSGQQWYSSTGMRRCWMREYALEYEAGSKFPEGRMKQWRIWSSLSSACLLIPG